MKSLKESIISTNNVDIISSLKYIVDEKPSQYNLSKLKRIWEDLNLNIPHCEWEINDITVGRIKIYGYKYVAQDDPFRHNIISIFTKNITERWIPGDVEISRFNEDYIDYVFQEVSVSKAESKYNKWVEDIIKKIRLVKSEKRYMSTMSSVFYNFN